MAKINGANARCLSRITGKTAHQEASSRTRTYDLVLAIRRRKMQWLGHILRLSDQRLVKLTIKVQYEYGVDSNMLYDAPATKNFDELVRMAEDSQAWKRLKNSIV